MNQMLHRLVASGPQALPLCYVLRQSFNEPNCMPTTAAHRHVTPLTKLINSLRVTRCPKVKFDHCRLNIFSGLSLAKTIVYRLNT
jgi:hypothetical protein